MLYEMGCDLAQGYYFWKAGASGRVLPENE